jgi:hypothetical protein
VSVVMGCSSPFYRGREEGSTRGRRRNGWRCDGDLMPQPLELELFHGVKEGTQKTSEHMAGEVMREVLVVRDRGRRCRMAVRNSGHWRWLPQLPVVRDDPS